MSRKSFKSVVPSLGLVCSMLVATAILAEGSKQVGLQNVGEADSVYKNGIVYTVDPVRTRAQAFAVRDGKFLAVGSNDDVKAVTGKDTRVVDLKGKMVMPGLVENP